MKLLILDKDGTLVRPKSGAKFVQDPQDQELLPGVAEAVSRYAAEGWAMVIASNQGGVAKQAVAMSKIEPGHYICNRHSKVENIVDGWDDQGAYHRLILENGERVEGRANSLIEMQYKTLEDAIAEMRYCLELQPHISSALFCPDFDGLTCFCVGRKEDFVVEAHEYWRRDLSGSYRKPNSGMIELALWQAESAIGASADKRKCLMVGDRPEDEQTAQNAGVKFMWADVWRSEEA